MEMIKAIKISDAKTLLDLRMNQYYVGVYRNGYISLNRYIRTKIKERLEENQEYLIRIVKISPPDQLEVAVINEAYEKEAEAQDAQEEVIDPKLKTKEFMISSPPLEKLRPCIIKAAALMRKAVSAGISILVRHHSDVDGYSAAVALERALLPLIEKKHKDKAYKYYTRSPMQAPFYSYSDALRDVGISMANVSKFGSKRPLLILLDNGSTKEDILALQKIKIYDFKVIVVDHHYPGEIKAGRTVNDDYIDVHINPYLIGHDSGLVSGMISAELARFVNEQVENISFIPALAGTGDKADNEEFRQYLKLSRLEPEFLEDLAVCIDYEADALRYMAGSDLVNDLFAANKENQKKAMELLLPEIRQKMNEMKKAVEKYYEKKQHKNFLLLKIDLEKVYVRGEFPPPRKIVGLMQKEHGKGSAISLGIMDDILIIRADRVRFDANKMMAELQKKMSHALIEGGGHEHAASMKFVKGAKQDVIRAVEMYLEQI